MTSGMEAVQVLLIEILLLPQTDHLKALCPTIMSLFLIHSSEDLRESIGHISETEYH